MSKNNGFDQAYEFSRLSADEAVLELSSDLNRGLGENEAQKRLKLYGPNEFKKDELMAGKILLRQFKSAFIYLLLLAAIVSFALGENTNGLMIIAFVLINVSLGFFQEYHSAKTVKMLEKLMRTQAKVIRDGEEKIIDAKHIVVGDLIVLETGDTVPADARLIYGYEVSFNESALTGETMPVTKSAEVLTKMSGKNTAATNLALAGTLVTTGHAKALVMATGEQTKIGKISELSSGAERPSGLEKGVSGLAKFILKLVVVTLVFVFLINLAIKGQAANMTELLIFSIALAVSVIPEALPVVISFSLSRGAKHLSKNKVVVKRLAAIEDLGGVEVLCTDKTGTLTKNILTVSDFFEIENNNLFAWASLSGQQMKCKVDPFDKAINNKLSSKDLALVKKYKPSEIELPFDPVRRRKTVIVAGEGKKWLIVRGAVEEILKITKLPEAHRQELTNFMDDCSKKGERLLAVAKKEIDELPTNIEVMENNLNLVGVIAFSDPIKKTTKQAVSDAEKLGLIIKILTGDSAAVAENVGRKVGLIKGKSKGVMEGATFEKLDSKEQKKAVLAYAIFARVAPEQKYKIIQLLQEKYSVGYLGDGINDAPALKIADVGMVVEGASDIARSAADIVLLQKSLAVIIKGIDEGRQVFQNTLKYIKITLTSNFGNFYAVAVASLLINFLPMTAIQLLLLNLLSDFPMIAIATDKVDPGEVKKPAHYNISEIVLLATILGVISSIFDFIFFAVFYRISPGVLQTNWFIGSVLTELALIYSLRSRLFCLRAKRASKPLAMLSLLAVAVTFAAVMLPTGREIFHFVRPTANHLLIIFAVVAVYFVLSEFVKLIYYKSFNRESAR